VNEVAGMDRLGGDGREAQQWHQLGDEARTVLLGVREGTVHGSLDDRGGRRAERASDAPEPITSVFPRSPAMPRARPSHGGGKSRLMVSGPGDPLVESTPWRVGLLRSAAPKPPAVSAPISACRTSARALGLFEAIVPNHTEMGNGGAARPRSMTPIW
jgi:hypothetical protein